MEPDRKDIDVSSLRINREKPVNRRNLLRLFIIIFLILFVITLTIVWSPNFIPFFRPVVSITKVAIISNSQASTVLTSSGYVVARNKAEISPKSVGRIAWINLEEGQKVKKGELVAKLENLELQAHRDQIVSNLENAKRELTRQKQLFVKGITTKQALDDAKTKVEVLMAQLRNAEELIRNTFIYSPINGVVTVKKAFLGETVTPQGFGGAGSAGATFAVIVDLDSLEVETDINEQYLDKLVTGMPTEVILDSYPDHPYEATLRKIVPTADRQKGTVTVKVEFLNKDERILPEMACRLNFLNPEIYDSKSKRSIIVVPNSSLINHNGAMGVFLFENTRVRFQPVITGEAFDSQIEISRGLVGGEEVVVEAETFGLKNADRVRLKEEE